MYACITDYPAIYNDAYRERRGDHTSFDRNVLPPLLLDFCKSRHLKRHLDISGGGGGLRDAMKQSGIETFVTDISADPSRAILELNLSQYDDESVERVRRSVNFGISPHLTTCFDVLEHIDKEHISAAARNLFELTERYLIVSISTRPSIRDNLLHASLISIQTWIAVFETAGFICDEIDVFPAATTQREFPDLPDYSLIKSWVGADLFDDIRFGEPRYLLLQKQTKGREDWAIKRSNIDNILDVAFRIVKRSQFKVENDTTYAFNLHHPQEWQYYRPLLDVLPRKQVKFFIRNQSIDDDFQRGVTGWLTRNGVSITQYEDVSELDWPSLRGSIVFTAGESSIDPK
ncbi:MAG: hypothetical protein IH582_00080, partial [Afipia sp.]|nr:hypothetical protein [Afipia sp.]